MVKPGRIIRLSSIDLEMLIFPSVTMSTILSSLKDGGHHDVESWLKSRIRAVLSQNPWLSGRLFASGDGTFSLWAPYSSGDDQSIAECFHHIEVDDIEKVAQFPPRDVLAPKGKGCNWESVLWKVTLCTQRGVSYPKKCALIASMCHALGDGATFFNVLNMLSESGTGVQSLSPDRIHSDDMAAHDQGLPRKMRQEMMNVSRSISGIKGFKRILSKMLHKAKALVVFDTSIATQQLNMASIALRKKEVSTRVSTNDVITSNLLRNEIPDLALMQINLRHRLAGLEANLAGNYIVSLILLPSDFATPEGVRRALDNALSPSMEARKLTFAPGRGGGCVAMCITNWTTFFHEITFPGYYFLRQEIPALPEHECTLFWLPLRKCFLRKLKLFFFSKMIKISVVYRPTKNTLSCAPFL